ncbi:ABC transporter permease [Alkalibacillus haloalkaliphilus]|uniref:ABC transporter permease n=1 Tax=Alkalibacillus haloalkaliphilus TaxID=94136 RepID=UPI002935DD3B|nr:ABC transporter permease [Alkalibacillus haloalkaliphilus]MDV2581837.1 ABC transporter permease [Alkalibacillus haloalkaliphilus]
MSLVHLISANTRMEFIELKRYLPNTIAMFMTFYIIFLAMFFGINVIGDPQHAETNIQYGIVNMVFWFLTMMTLSNIGFTITLEATRGTLEQLYMSPYGVWRILLARFIGYLMINSVIVVLLLAATMLTANQWLNLQPHIVIPLLFLTIIGIIGIGFMIAGMTVIFKQMSAFLQILQFILMGLAFVPLSIAPFLVLAPFVKGFDMVREVMIHGYTWSHFTAVDLSILTVNSLVYLIIGVLVYLKCEKVAMTKGLIGNY